MKEYEASDPLDIGFFGPDAVVLGANGIAHLIQQFRFLAVLVHVLHRGHNHTCDTIKDHL